MTAMQKTLEKHPAPWRTGWQHEWMCQVCDANNKVVLTIETAGFDDTDADVTAQAIIEAFNFKAQFYYPPIVACNDQPIP